MKHAFALILLLSLAFCGCSKSPEQIKAERLAEYQAAQQEYLDAIKISDMLFSEERRLLSEIMVAEKEKDEKRTKDVTEEYKQIELSRKKADSRIRPARVRIEEAWEKTL